MYFRCFVFLAPSTHRTSTYFKDSRDNADTTDNVTTPPYSTSSGHHHHARAAYCCGWLLDRRLRSVTHHHLSLPFCAERVRPVCRGPLKTKCGSFENMVKWPRCPILDIKARLRSSQISRLRSSFNLLFYEYYGVLRRIWYDEKQTKTEAVRSKIHSKFSFASLV